MSKLTPYYSVDSQGVPQWIDGEGNVYEERLTNPYPTFKMVRVGLDRQAAGKSECEPDAVDIPVAPLEEEDEKN